MDPPVRPVITTMGWSVDDLVTKYGFLPVRRVHWSHCTTEDITAYESGMPLIISGLNQHHNWNPNFNIKFFEQALKEPCQLSVRNVRTSTDGEMHIKDFLYHCETNSVQASQAGKCMSRKILFSESHVVNPEPARFYAKDAPCPDDWKHWLQSGAIHPDLVPEGSNDVLKNLPQKDRPETLMTYLGYGDTFTPFHKAG